jgi:hypothetical protein
MSKAPEAAVKEFKWSRPSDATKEWDIFYRQLKTLYLKKNIAFILSKEATALKRLPIPEEATYAESLGLKKGLLSRWTLESKFTHDVRVVGLAAQKLIENAFELGHAILEEQFDINCNA